MMELLVSGPCECRSYEEANLLCSCADQAQQGRNWAGGAREVEGRVWSGCIGLIWTREHNVLVGDLNITLWSLYSTFVRHLSFIWDNAFLPCFSYISSLLYTKQFHFSAVGSRGETMNHLVIFLLLSLYSIFLEVYVTIYQSYLFIKVEFWRSLGGNY